MQEKPLSDFSFRIDFDREKRFLDFIIAMRELGERDCGWLLVKFRQYTARFFPTGKIGVINKLHLSREIGWEQEWGDILTLIKALEKAGYINYDGGKVEVIDWMKDQQQMGYRARGRMKAAISQGYNVKLPDVEIIIESGLMTKGILTDLKKVFPEILKEVSGKYPDVINSVKKARNKRTKKVPVPIPVAVVKIPTLQVLSGLTVKDKDHLCERFDLSMKQLVRHLVSLDNKMVTGDLDKPIHSTLKAVEGLLEARLK